MFDGKVPPPHGNPFREKQMLGAEKQQQEQEQRNTEDHQLHGGEWY